MSENLVFEKKEHIAYITMNRPERGNAINLEMYKLLQESFKRINDDDDIWVAIITGAGERTFCSGMDLKDVGGLLTSTERMGDLLTSGTAGFPIDDPFLLNMRSVKKPIISAINGNVFAGGFILSLNSDIRIAVKDISFSITEAKLGRGSPWAIPLVWMLPLGIVMELTLTGDPIPAERMYQLGLINRLVNREELMPTAVAIAERIRDNAPLSVKAAKESLLNAIDLGCKAGIDKAIEIYLPLYLSEDAREGPKAFIEKRKPVWRNK